MAIVAAVHHVSSVRPACFGLIAGMALFKLGEKVDRRVPKCAGVRLNNTSSTYTRYLFIVKFGWCMKIEDFVSFFKSMGITGKNTS
jgi:hypothetical protein